MSITGNGVTTGDGAIAINQVTGKYYLDVGVTVFGGTPSYVNIDTAIEEFKTFIETYSNLILNITKIRSYYFIPASDITMDGGTGFLMKDQLLANDVTNAYSGHRVSLTLYDTQSISPTYGGLTWNYSTFGGNSVCIIPYGEIISWYPIEGTWGSVLASTLVHEFLHCIDVDSQSCPSLGYNTDNDPGWKNCYIYLLGQITPTKYTTIITPNYSNLSVLVGTNGSTNPNVGTYPRITNSKTYITANPSSGYVFSSWGVDSTYGGTTNPYPMVMRTNHSIQPFFEVYVPPPTPFAIVIHNSFAGYNSVIIDGVTYYLDGDVAFLFVGSYTLTVDIQLGTFDSWSTSGDITIDDLGYPNYTLNVSGNGDLTLNCS